MTIRSCFYPLIGNHIYSVIGDIIDALSMTVRPRNSPRNHGCAVAHLTDAPPLPPAGDHLRRVHVARPRRDAAQRWPELHVDDVGTGADRGHSDSHAVIVLGITLIATTKRSSPASARAQAPLDPGDGARPHVFLTVTLADNTWYLANVFTQAIGYYAQHIIGTAFDCEAFQQLGTSSARQPALGLRRRQGRRARAERRRDLRRGLDGDGRLRRAAQPVHRGHPPPRRTPPTAPPASPPSASPPPTPPSPPSSPPPRSPPPAGCCRRSRCRAARRTRRTIPTRRCRRG